MTKYTSVDEYVTSFPLNIQSILNEIRKIIQENVPKAQEQLSYQMIAYKLDGRAIAHFAAWKNHIGFYGVSTEIQKELKNELLTHASIGEKGTIQFSLNKPMPLHLITKLVQKRVTEQTS